jgi:hypothetical protein
MSEAERDDFYRQLYDAFEPHRQPMSAVFDSPMMDGIEARAQLAEDQMRKERKEARDAVLDLAEVCGLEVSPERRQQVEAADQEELRALRTALKATRAWP